MRAMTMTSARVRCRQTPGMARISLSRRSRSDRETMAAACSEVRLVVAVLLVLAHRLGAADRRPSNG
jgi:hypothetical protein